MTGPERDILAAQRAGKPVTAAMTCATISTLDELNSYRVGLSDRGALTSDAMSAICDRQDALMRGEA